MLSQGVTNLSVLCEPVIEDLCCVLNAKPKASGRAIRILACMSMKPALWALWLGLCVCIAVRVWKTQREYSCLFTCECLKVLAGASVPNCLSLHGFMDYLQLLMFVCLFALCCWPNPLCLCCTFSHTSSHSISANDLQSAFNVWHIAGHLMGVTSGSELARGI